MEASDAIARHPHLELVGFVDDDPAKQGRSIARRRVLGASGNLANLIRSHSVSDIFLCTQSMPPVAVQEIHRCCAAAGVRFNQIPTLNQILGLEDSLPELSLRPDMVLSSNLLARGIGRRCGNIRLPFGSPGTFSCTKSRVQDHSVTFALYIFWTCFLLIAHTYFFYPVILFLAYAGSQVLRDWRYLKSRSNRRAMRPGSGQLPDVTVIVPLYNEASCLLDKLGNLRQSDYPLRKTRNHARL